MPKQLLLLLALLQLPLQFLFQLGFKVVVKNGTNKIKSNLQTIDFENDTIKFKIKKIDFNNSF